jgi:diphthamide biosynthesis protein 3
VAAVVSKQLVDSAQLILKLASADSSPSKEPGDINQLATKASALQESIANQTTSIVLTRARVTELGDQIHAAYRDLFEISIRIIEQTIHGSIARGTKARAEHLAVVAKGMELKLQIMAQTDSILSDPTLQSELETYKSRLQLMDEDLSLRATTAEKALADYERAGKGMAEIAKRYAQLKQECEAVREEIRKLESRKSDVD